MLKRIFGVKNKKEKDTIVKKYIEQHNKIKEMMELILKYAINRQPNSLKETIEELDSFLTEHIKNEKHDVYDYLLNKKDNNVNKTMINQILEVREMMVPIRKKISVTKLRIYTYVKSDNYKELVQILNHINQELLNVIKEEELKVFKYLEFIES